ARGSGDRANERAGGVIPLPLVDHGRGHRAADAEIGEDEDVAVAVGAGEGLALAGHAADRVLEEPEAHRGVAAVVEAGGAGVEDLVAVGSLVQGSEGVFDVVLALRLAAGREPGPLLDAGDVLGAAAGEDVITAVDRIVRKTA